PSVYAQRLASGAQTELGDWLDRQKKQHEFTIELQAQLTQLQSKYDDDRNEYQRTEIADCERYLSDVHRVRADASRFLPPFLIPALDWMIKYIDAKKDSLAHALSAEERKTAADRAELSRQIGSKQLEIAQNTELERVIAQQIQELRDDRERAGKSADLQALEV